MADRWVTIESIRCNVGADAVKSLVDTQMEIIDDAILSTNSAGGNAIEHDLPINPIVAGLPRRQAELVIYTEILQLYRTSIKEGGKGFDRTYIKHVGNRNIIRIEWENVLSEDECKARQEYLRKCMWENRT